MGCATPPKPTLPNPSIPKMVFVYPTIKEEWLTCLPEPKPSENLETDAEEHSTWVEPLRQAGGDCRTKLGEIRDFYRGWPREEAPTSQQTNKPTSK